MKNEWNTHTVEIDGTEYELEIVGDEIVVSNFSKAFGALIQFIAKPGERTLRKFMEPRKALFSFTGTPELIALIRANNEYYDTHNEAACEPMCRCIDKLTEPHIRAWLAARREGQGTS